MHRVTRKSIAIIAVLIGVGLIFAGCGTNSTGTPQSNELNTQQNNYAQLARQQPSHTMGYSPTRDTINFWIDTWKTPGKLSYVYLSNANGQITGYYIFKGLPVSYCASQTPTYTYQDVPGDGIGDKVQLPAPSIDGVYYGGSGSCNTYYGRDASNNAYIEYTAGLGINVLLYDRPLPAQTVGDAKPLGFATTGNVR